MDAVVSGWETTWCLSKREYLFPTTLVTHGSSNLAKFLRLHLNIFLLTIYFKQYLLVRPYPSLRIIFVSPALRIPGLLQSPFLSRIGGPAHVREGLSDAFQASAAVTAKVTWLANGRASEDGGDIMNGDSRPGSRRGGSTSDNGQRTRYISCTPLLGSDDEVGVWMVVMVENELVTGSLASRTAALARYDMPIPPTPSEYQRESVSMDGDFNTGGGHAKFERTNSQYVRDQRRGKNGSEGLYAISLSKLQY